MFYAWVWYLADIEGGEEISVGTVLVLTEPTVV